MRHVSRTHRVDLDRLFDRINLKPKIQIKYMDTKNQLADMLTKGNFTRDEWNHLFCLFNISHFSSTVCSEVMSKRSQKESGEERVTAKSRPMMSLIARAPSNLSSPASESPVKKSYGSQSPWSAKAEKYDRTEQPVVDRDTSHAPGHHHKQFVESSYSARYSGWNVDKNWSSQEWKADELMDDRTGTPVVCPWARTHEFQSSFSREKTKHIIVEEKENHDGTVTPDVDPQKRRKATAIHHWEGRNRIGFLVRMQIILGEGEQQVMDRLSSSASTTSCKDNTSNDPFCDVQHAINMATV